MTDEPEETPERKVIEGGVAAKAGAADVAVNQPDRFCVKEIVHHRYMCHPETGQELGRHTLIEYEITDGTPPEKWGLFKGLGMLQAQTPPPPAGLGHQRREYRFNIYADTVEEAWEKFEEYEKRGAAQAEAAFRREFAEWQTQQSQRLAVVQGPGAVQGILGPDGRTPL